MNESIRRSEWVSVGTSVDPLKSTMLMAVSADVPTDEEWHPAGFESGRSMIRVPASAPDGACFVWVKLDDGRPTRDRVVHVVG